MERRMQMAAELAENEGKMSTPLMKRLHKPRSVFSPGHRIRMNIVPMFVNIFVPWGIFVFVLATNSFWMAYSKPGQAMFITGIVVVIWLISVLIAIERRKNDPEPSWYIFFSVMLGFALWGALLLGHNIFNNNSLPFYMIKDLKVVSGLDASKEHGQNVMDAGMFYFNEGNQIDAVRSWHFKQGTTYCVAPIIKGGYGTVPNTQSFDFWAVGKDCCSTAASDFRCGAYNNPLARAGIRILDDKDRPYYRLAVEQAESLYGIISQHPVFFEWAQDPLETVNLWNERAFTHYVMFVTFAFLISLTGVACASCKFSWLGRVESLYGTDVHGDSDYNMGGPQIARDFAQARQV